MNQDPYNNPQQPASLGSSSGLPPVQPQQYGQFQPRQTANQPVNQPYDPFAQPQQPQQFQQNAPQTTPQPLTNFSNPEPQFSGKYNDDYNTVDYLNKIAPKQQKTVNQIAVFGMIGAVIASAAAIVFMLANPGAPSDNELIQPISDRAATLTTIVDDNEKKLSQTEISAANTSLSSVLTTMKSQLDAIIKERKIQKTSTASEKTYLSNIQKELETAHQKGVLDSAYATTMTYEVTVLRAKISKLKKTTNSKKIQEFCDESIQNLDTILKSYEQFSSTKQ